MKVLTLFVAGTDILLEHCACVVETFDLEQGHHITVREEKL